jgi:hypothetical protein
MLKELENEDNEDESGDHKKIVKEDPSKHIVKTIDVPMDPIIIKSDVKEEVKPIADNEDLYPEIAEKMYHKPDKFKSIGVLQEELNVIDEIINYKKARGFDYDDFESKKDMVDCEIEKLQNLCSCGAMDVDTYKKVIEAQVKYEDILIEYLKKDTKLTKSQADKILERINKRKEIINRELTQEVQEEEEEPEKKEEERITDVTNIATANNTIADESIKDSNITNKSEEPVKKTIVVDEKLYTMLRNRVDEYREAIDYFRKIGSGAQETDAISKAKELVYALKDMEAGKTVDEFSLPPSVSPDYICGYSKQERLDANC